MRIMGKSCGWEDEGIGRESNTVAVAASLDVLWWVPEPAPPLLGSPKSIDHSKSLFY